MLDVGNLSQTILDELRRPRWLLLSDPRDLPPAEVFATVLEEVLWATTLAEEGRPCRPRLLWGEPPAEAEYRLEEPQAFTRQNLRKLTGVHGPRGYLTFRIHDGEVRITGVAPRFGQGHPGNLILATVGVLSFDVLSSAERIVSVRAGEVRKLGECALPNLTEASRRVRTAVSGTLGPEHLAPIVQEIFNSGHGGSVWIVRQHAPLTLKKGWRIAGAPLPGTWTADTHQRIELETWLTSAGQLAAADGSLIIDGDASVRAFGAYVAVPGESIEIRTHKPDGTSDATHAESLGGGRHASAAAFCKSHAPAAAIVVSADGRITLVTCSSEGAHVDAWEVASLGMPADLGMQ